MYKVIKKDGNLEDFDRSKIVSGAMKAGVTAIQAESLASEIEAWLPTVAVDNAVNSSNIRTKCLEILNTISVEATNRFGSYTKPADK